MPRDVFPSCLPLPPPAKPCLATKRLHGITSITMKMTSPAFLYRALAIVCGLASILLPLNAPAAPVPKAPKRASVTVKASPGNVFEVRNYKLCLRADPSAPPVSLNIDVVNSIITFAPDGGLASKSTEPIVLDAIARDGFTGLTRPAELHIINTLRSETVFLVKSGLVRAFGGSIRVQTGRDQPTAGVSESGWESLQYRDLTLFTAKGSVRLMTGDFSQKDMGAGQKPVAPAVGGGGGGGLSSQMVWQSGTSLLSRR